MAPPLKAQTMPITSVPMRTSITRYAAFTDAAWTVGAGLHHHTQFLEKNSSRCCCEYCASRPWCMLQKDMLEDHKRTGAYYAAVRQNRRQFEGKVVLDVGTGSGILAIFAAQAGAKTVYAVEATSMAKHAQKLVEAHQVGAWQTLVLPHF